MWIADESLIIADTLGAWHLIPWTASNFRLNLRFVCSVPPQTSMPSLLSVCQPRKATGTHWACSSARPGGLGELSTPAWRMGTIWWMPHFLSFPRMGFIFYCLRDTMKSCSCVYCSHVLTPLFYWLLVLPPFLPSSLYSLTPASWHHLPKKLPALRSLPQFPLLKEPKLRPWSYWSPLKIFNGSFPFPSKMKLKLLISLARY